MWQNRFDSRLELEPSASRYLLIYLVTLHALALLALMQPLRLPLWGQILLGVAVVLSLGYWIRRQTQLRGRGVKLTWRRDGQWDYRDHRQEFRYATLLPGSYISRYLIILHLQPLQGKAIRVLLLPDMISRELWHRLWLRLSYVEFDDN